jgi:acyl-CoA synthetase (NDP forming)
MSAARAAARNKPVLVVKVGRFAEGAYAAEKTYCHIDNCDQR